MFVNERRQMRMMTWHDYDTKGIGHALLHIVHRRFFWELKHGNGVEGSHCDEIKFDIKYIIIVRSTIYAL